MVKPKVIQQVTGDGRGHISALQVPLPPHRVPLLLLFVLEGELKPEFFLFLCSGQGLGHPSHALCVALRVWAVALKASGGRLGFGELRARWW